MIPFFSRKQHYFHFFSSKMKPIFCLCLFLFSFFPTMVFAQWTDAPATAQREAIQARNEARALAEKAEKKLDFNLGEGPLSGGINPPNEGFFFFLKKLGVRPRDMAFHQSGW